MKEKATNEFEEGRTLSILSPDEVAMLGGLPGEAVAGVFAGEVSDLASFRPNRVFIDFLHYVIKTYGPHDPSLLAGAEQQVEGWLYLIDLRTPQGPQGRVPVEDIIGAFEVKEGELAANSYQPSESHKVLTENGLVQLPPFLRKAFLEELKLRKTGDA